MKNSTTVIQADVAIIGAGPAGTAAAAHLGQLGVGNVVLTDKQDFPRDKTCGSAVSPKGIRVLRRLGVWEDIKPHALWINGLRLVTPGEREAYVSGGEKLDAIICNRRILDHLLLKRALRGGVTFIPHFCASELLEEDGRVIGFRASDGREVHAHYTVVAGGSHCTLTTRGKAAPQRIIQAIMGWWEGVPHRPHHVEMVFDRMIAPYYGWLFPESEQIVNIGITYEDVRHEKRARDLFQRFLDKHYRDRLANAKQVGRWKGHPITYDYRVEKLTSPGRIVVGESGRLTHPATAEGIYQGMRSGMMAAEALRDILLRGQREWVAFGAYELRCKKAFWLSFAGGRLFRRAVQTPLLDWAVGATGRPLVRDLTAKAMALM
jgi:geranylgeranyl reductase family protein